MSAEVIKVFDYLGEKLGIAIDWTQENVMPYLEDLMARFVKLNIIETCLSLGIALICLIIGSIFFICMLKEYNTCKINKKSNFFWSYDNYWGTTLNGPAIVGTIILGISALFGVIGTPIFIADLIKWIIVPEFQIVEEISYMMQTMGG